MSYYWTYKRGLQVRQLRVMYKADDLLVRLYLRYGYHREIEIGDAFWSVQVEEVRGPFGMFYPGEAAARIKHVYKTLGKPVACTVCGRPPRRWTSVRDKEIVSFEEYYTKFVDIIPDDFKRKVKDELLHILFFNCCSWECRFKLVKEHFQEWKKREEFINKFLSEANKRQKSLERRIRTWNKDQNQSR